MKTTTTTTKTSSNGFGSISHPSMPILMPFLEKYPLQAASLIQSWFDLNHSAGWTELEILDVKVEEQKEQVEAQNIKTVELQQVQKKRGEIDPRKGWVAIRGRRRDSVSTLVAGDLQRERGEKLLEIKRIHVRSAMMLLRGRREVKERASALRNFQLDSISRYLSDDSSTASETSFMSNNILP